MKKRVLVLSAVVTALLLMFCAQALAVTLPKSVSISGTPTTLGMAQGSNTENNIAPIKITVKPSSALRHFRVVSSKPSVLEVFGDGDIWYMKSVSPGLSYVTVVAQKMGAEGWVDTKVRRRTAIRVKSAVKLTSLTCKPKKLTLHVGEEYALDDVTVQYKPSMADCVAPGKGVTPLWSSCKSSVAQVQDGKIVALKKGTCKIIGRAPDGSGKKAIIYLTVKNVAPKSIVLNQSEAVLAPQEKLSLSYEIFPENTTNQRVTWRSNKPKIASVDNAGCVTALKEGTATIVCRSSAKSSILAKCKITVRKKTVEGTVCHFYSVVNSDYQTYVPLPPVLNDQKLISGAFLHARDAGMRVTDITLKQNLTGGQMISFMESMASAGADEDDVTVFFYSGHGLNPDGALVGVDGKKITGAQVRACLDRIPGHVILILDSCYSGSYIMEKSSAQTSAAAPEAYNRAVIAAFSDSASGTKAKSASSKYSILTACAADQLSWCGNHYSFFSFLAGTGMGCGWPDLDADDLLADANRNKTVTVSEVYRYATDNIDELLALSGVPEKDWQDIQMWPENDQTTLVSRKAA